MIAVILAYLVAVVLAADVVLAVCAVVVYRRRIRVLDARVADAARLRDEARAELARTREALGITPE